MKEIRHEKEKDSRKKEIQILSIVLSVEQLLLEENSKKTSI